MSSDKNPEPLPWQAFLVLSALRTISEGDGVAVTGDDPVGEILKIVSVDPDVIEFGLTEADRMKLITVRRGFISVKERHWDDRRHRHKVSRSKAWFVLGLCDAEFFSAGWFVSPDNKRVHVVCAKHLSSTCQPGNILQSKPDWILKFASKLAKSGRDDFVKRFGSVETDMTVEVSNWLRSNAIFLPGMEGKLAIPLDELALLCPPVRVLSRVHRGDSGLGRSSTEDKTSSVGPRTAVPEARTAVHRGRFVLGETSTEDKTSSVETPTNGHRGQNVLGGNSDQRSPRTKRPRWEAHRGQNVLGESPFTSEKNATNAVNTPNQAVARDVLRAPPQQISDLLASYSDLSKLAEQNARESGQVQPGPQATDQAERPEPKPDPALSEDDLRETSLSQYRPRKHFTRWLDRHGVAKVIIDDSCRDYCNRGKRARCPQHVHEKIHLTFINKKLQDNGQPVVKYSTEYLRECTEADSELSRVSRVTQEKVRNGGKISRDDIIRLFDAGARSRGVR